MRGDRLGSPFHAAALPPPLHRAAREGRSMATFPLGEVYRGRPDVHKTVKSRSDALLPKLAPAGCWAPGAPAGVLPASGGHEAIPCSCRSRFMSAILSW